MRQFTALAAAALVAAVLSSGPAKADYHYGPVENAGQCWKPSPTSRDFGYWSACPKPASTSVTHTVRRQRHH